MTARDDREREKTIRETIGKFFLVFALDDEDQSWSEMGEGVINS